MKHRYFIELAYNGTRFHGWQVQPNAISVQGTLEQALAMMCGESVRLTGAGRTDAGVHASYFVAHFDTEQEKIVSENLVYRLNRYLGPDLVIQRITEVRLDLHARFDAVARTYRYFICQQKDPFHQETSWYYPPQLDLEKMNAAGNLLKTMTDFTSFSKLHTDVKTNHCRVDYARWTHKEHQLCFEIQADRFLRNMVRAIVGTLLEVGLNKLTLQDFKLIIDQKDRCKAGTSVPACGLFLVAIRYPSELFVPIASTDRLYEDI